MSTLSKTPSELETYFQQFRKHIVGNNQTFQSPYGEKEIIYTDWTASGRMYRPIEEKLLIAQREETIIYKEQLKEFIINLADEQE